MSNILFSREWAMLSKDTFSVKPIANFVQKYLKQSRCSVDPFARNCNWASYTNDINPNTSAHSHMDAIEFIKSIQNMDDRIDLVILDAPYTPRQISECYKEIGRKVTMEDTQNSRFMKDVKDAADKLLRRGGVVLSFCYNSSGMGINRGYEIEEIKLINGGAAHNDIICMAERKI